MNRTKFDFFSHPLFDPLSLKIETLQVKALFSVVMNWIWSGLPGGYIVGDARTGKSTGIEMNLPRLYNRQDIPIEARWVIIPPRDQNTIKATYYSINTALGLRLNPRVTADVLSEQIINHLAEIAYNSPAKTVVLFVDEFQRLNPAQLQVFAELYDKMRLVKLSLCVIFVANHQESNSLLEAISDYRNSHIRGRFFTQSHHFQGFTQVEEIEHALTQIDELRFPQDNGPTYTEYFLPEAYNSGFRLGSVADLIWKIYYERFRQKVKLSSWPAQYFFQMITILLTDYLFEEGVDNLDQDMIADAIENSLILPNLVKIQ